MIFFILEVDIKNIYFVFLIAFCNIVYSNTNFDKTNQQVKSAPSKNKEVTDVNYDDINNIIEINDTVKLPEYVKQQDSSRHIIEDIELTKTYNTLLQNVFNDLQHYDQVSQEVLKDYEHVNKGLKNLYNPDPKVVGFAAMLGKNKQLSSVINTQSLIGTASKSARESKAFSDSYRSYILSHPRKVYLARNEFEGSSCEKNQKKDIDKISFNISPCSKYGDVYIPESMYTKYKNNDLTLTTVLLHEAFHALVMPDIERSQMIEGASSALVFGLSPRDKTGKFIPRGDAKQHMHKWMDKQKRKGISEIEIDKLTLLHLRENKAMRQKYLGVLASFLKNSNIRLVAANYLDKYIDDENDVKTLEHNLINIKASILNPLIEIALNPSSMSPESMRKKINQSPRLNPHAIKGNTDNYKEYMAIAIGDIKNPQDEGEF